MVSPSPKRTPDEDSMPSLSTLVELSLSRHELQTLRNWLTYLFSFSATHWR